MVLSSQAEIAKPATTRKGNALAQFIIFSALTCVTYQCIATRFSSTVDDAHGIGNKPRSSRSSILEQHRATRRESMSTTEFSCFVACVGIFGLMQRSKQRLEIEARIKAQRHHEPVELQDTNGKTDNSYTDEFTGLPSDVKQLILLYLEPQELVTCVMVNTTWYDAVGDRAEFLWKNVFQRDFYENGERFRTIFPRVSWRQYYFFHHLSRPVEIARWLGKTQKRKCIVIHGLVYDVTTFLDHHPGGLNVLGDVIGTDATDTWEQFQHSNEAKEMMKEFVVYDLFLDELHEGKRDKLKGNLSRVQWRWKYVSWWIGYAHLFGQFSTALVELCLWIITWRTTTKARVFHIESSE